MAPNSPKLALLLVVPCVLTLQSPAWRFRDGVALRSISVKSRTAASVDGAFSATAPTAPTEKNTPTNESAPSVKIAAAKARLRDALAANDRSTKAPEVVAAVEALAALNPTPRPAASPLFCGEWVQTSDPDFPGSLGQDADGRVQYTLGRLGFNLFKPKQLVCSIDQPRNPVAESGDGLSYDFVVPLYFKTESGERVKGTLRNRAECVVASDTRLSVKFLGGELRPDVDECDAWQPDCDAWRSTFEDAFSAKTKKRERVANWLMAKLMGLTRPDGLGDDGAMAYELRKPMEAFVDVLYGSRVCFARRIAARPRP
mmetsp:Transcript_30948/g.92910  ORF Transcript_30948/g.92910 Transcript_30948/m.92910 type:complete len:314 (-) Transcript_30948:15-956(-)